MCMQIIKKLKKYTKSDALKGKKELKNYAIHKKILELGAKMSASSVIDGMEKEGARRVLLDQFYALEDAWVDLTGRSREEFHEINRKEFGAGSKYRK